MEHRITVKVINLVSSKDAIVYLSRGEKLLDALVSLGIYLPNDCGGMGTCGKCAVQIIEGALEITRQDKEVFSEVELVKGYRLACMAYPSSDCTIMLSLANNAKYTVVTDTVSNLTSKSLLTSFNNQKKEYVVAIDLGTTTLALALVAMPEGNIIGNHTAINPQRVYGADVISRIKASNEGKLQLLTRLIRNELLYGVQSLVKEQQMGLDNIKQIIISGNTTMIHLLMGYPCNGLGAYPYRPVNIGLINAFTDDIFSIDDKIPIMILPGITVFVGGDISAGLLACGIDLEEKPCLFIDLGTNGEMALGNRDRILVTSTAAGPAFEGANISCGVGSIPGAICHVSTTGERLSYETIDKESVTGICGTGALELVSELLKDGIMDSTGLLMDPYFDNGYPIAGLRFTQGDIRELQLAKAAIRAGVEILTRSYGISYDQLDKVYLAGGFGYHLDIDKAIRIGLLPKEVEAKTKAVGNTSLSGAICSVRDPLAKKRLGTIISACEEIHLSNNDDFNDLFIQYISF